MTGADHEHSHTVEEAAQWLADQRDPPRPAVPALRERFGLTALEACESIAMANRIQLSRMIA